MPAGDCRYCQGNIKRQVGESHTHKKVITKRGNNVCLNSFFKHVQSLLEVSPHKSVFSFLKPCDLKIPLTTNFPARTPNTGAFPLIHTFTNLFRCQQIYIEYLLCARPPLGAHDTASAARTWPLASCS